MHYITSTIQCLWRMLGVSTVSIGASVDGWSGNGKISERWISHVRLADDITHSAQWETERVTKESEKHGLIVSKIRQKWSSIVLDDKIMVIDRAVSLPQIHCPSGQEKERVDKFIYLTSVAVRETYGWDLLCQGCLSSEMITLLTGIPN